MNVNVNVNSDSIGNKDGYDNLFEMIDRQLEQSRKSFPNKNN